MDEKDVMLRYVEKVQLRRKFISEYIDEICEEMKEFLKANCVCLYI